MARPLGEFLSCSVSLRRRQQLFKNPSHRPALIVELALKLLSQASARHLCLGLFASTAITLTPEGSTFQIAGDWNLLGRLSDGAGGPDRNSRAYAFSLSLAA